MKVQSSNYDWINVYRVIEILFIVGVLISTVYWMSRITSEFSSIESTVSISERKQG